MALNKSDSPETVYNDEEGNLKPVLTEGQIDAKFADDLAEGKIPEDEVPETPSVIADRQRILEQEEARKAQLEKVEEDKKRVAEEKKAADERAKAAEEK